VNFLEKNDNGFQVLSISCSRTAPIAKSEASVTKRVFARVDGCARKAALASCDLAEMNAFSASRVQIISRLSFFRESFIIDNCVVGLGCALLEGGYAYKSLGHLKIDKGR